MTFAGELLQDIRYGWRTMARHSGFSAVAIVTLAIGIGSNTAIFSAFNEIFVRAAPQVTDPTRLVALGRAGNGRSFDGFGHLAYLKYREQARSYSGLAASRGASVLLRDGGDTVTLQAQIVSGNYFYVLGVPIAPGRAFLPDEDRTPGAHPVAVVSHALWKRRFDADPALVGRRIRLNDTDFAVVGIAAEGFRGLELGDAVDVWLPLMMEAQARPRFPQLNSDFFSTLSVVGRLMPGVTLEQAEAELTVLASRIEVPDGGTKQRRRVILTPHIRLPDPGWRAEAVSILGLLSVASVLVLALVCANLACLLLARATARRQEISVRAALGASRSRIIRQLLGEGVALAALGLVASLFVSSWIAGLFRTLVDPDLDFSLDRTVFLFASFAATVAALAFGLAPALDATRLGLAAAMKGHRAVAMRRPWLLRALVGVQVALSVVLLTGAGVFVRTLQKAGAVDIGFETKRLWLVEPDLELAGYSDTRARAFYQQIVQRLTVLPGVQTVSAASRLPRYGDDGSREFDLEGREPGAGATRVRVEYNEVSPRYFETLGVPITRGRAFVPQDDAGAPRVAIINEAMARAFWPGADPLHKTLRLVEFMALSAPIAVVGVVRDSRTIILEPRARPELLVPEAQSRRANLTILVRASSDSATVGAAIARAVRELDPALPRMNVESLKDRMAQGLSDQRMYAELTSVFGAFAALLALVGLYGTMAFTVSLRTRDIGIRMALGAGRGNIWWMVLREGLAVTAVGIVVGVFGSIAVTRLLTSHLYGVTPNDPLTFAISVLLLMAGALVASWWPAHRATRINPLAALRRE